MILKRFERGVLCDVFTSRRLDESNNTFVVETYMRNNQVVNIDPAVIPIAIHMTSKLSDVFNQTDEFYIFNSGYNSAFASTAKCFSGKEKVSFGVRFTYPDYLLQKHKDFERDYQLSKLYNQLMKITLEQYNVSMVRIAPLQILSDQKGFSVFTSVVSSAPAICQYKLSI